MAGEVEIVLMTPHRTDHEGHKPRTQVRLSWVSWAKAWIIGKADLTMNGCLYEGDVDSTLLLKVLRFLSTEYLIFVSFPLVFALGSNTTASLSHPRSLLRVVYSHFPSCWHRAARFERHALAELDRSLLLTYLIRDIVMSPTTRLLWGTSL
jgi:hypothetical protein